MFTRLIVVGAALIIAVPALAANNGGSANTSASIGHVTTAGGSAGPSGGARSGGAHEGGLGAHSAAMSTHLGAAAHTLHAPTAHLAAGRAAKSEHVAAASKPPKKPGPGEERTHHRFLHQPANVRQIDWFVCLERYRAADGWWSDCDRPAKSSSGPHS